MNLNIKIEDLAKVISSEELSQLVALFLLNQQDKTSKNPNLDLQYSTGVFFNEIRKSLFKEDVKSILYEESFFSHLTLHFDFFNQFNKNIQDTILLYNFEDCYTLKEYNFLLKYEFLYLKDNIIYISESLKEVLKNNSKQNLFNDEIYYEKEIILNYIFKQVSDRF